MIIECPHCETKVDGKEKGRVEGYDKDYPVPHAMILIECPVCQNPLLGSSELIQTGLETWGWDPLYREWPKQDSAIDTDIPEIARNSLIEANICFKAGAYSACAVMCGRTIEGVCIHHNPKNKTLASGLKNLKTDEIIDKRIYEWGEELRKHRNIGAHATAEKISKEDAKDLLDFSSAICEYVFVLNAKFNRFIERNENA